ncbi:hypothetical protein GCM10009304_39660 [Pseudomonas matsuisoli]|uniref:Uncharacterized protein n=1 Tax=Pseudomonas matsuisoli TaxID=1515666 RepID=A0A917Q3F5_9PSED|nr:hypothetical protein GCM10009304_39660 [Pseudomonas matsuisoli]
MLGNLAVTYHHSPTLLWERAMLAIAMEQSVAGLRLKATEQNPCERCVICCDGGG